jgi:hypothetical protein
MGKLDKIGTIIIDANEKGLTFENEQW